MKNWIRQNTTPRLAGIFRAAAPPMHIGDLEPIMAIDAAGARRQASPRRRLVFEEHSLPRPQVALESRSLSLRLRAVVSSDPLHLASDH
jgi:hypothetical protein